eukprot:5097154-Prymnesium_polylepis.1
MKAPEAAVGALELRARLPSGTPLQRVALTDAGQACGELACCRVGGAKGMVVGRWWDHADTAERV